MSCLSPDESCPVTLGIEENANNNQQLTSGVCHADLAPDLRTQVGAQRAHLFAPEGVSYGWPMAPQTAAASKGRKKADEATAVAPELTPDPDGDIAEGRLTRYDSSEAFIASLEQRS